MAGITPYGVKAMLDYTLGGAAEAAIAAWSVAVATSTAPTTASMYEIATGEGANRATVTIERNTGLAPDEVEHATADLGAIVVV